MKAHVSGMTLGVEDVERAKRFYGEGLGCPVEMDAQGYVGSFADPDGHLWNVAVGAGQPIAAE